MWNVDLSPLDEWRKYYFRSTSLTYLRVKTYTLYDLWLLMYKTLPDLTSSMPECLEHRIENTVRSLHVTLCNSSILFHVKQFTKIAKNFLCPTFSECKKWTQPYDQSSNNFVFGFLTKNGCHLGSQYILPFSDEYWRICIKF